MQPSPPGVAPVFYRGFVRIVLILALAAILFGPLLGHRIVAALDGAGSS